MGNPQNPDAPPAPYAPPGSEQDWNAPAPPMDTPGLAVPTAPAGAAKQGAKYWEDLGNANNTNLQPAPAALASTGPDIGVPGALAPPVPVGPQTGGQGSGGAPALEPSGASYSGAGYGGSPVGEAQARAKRDAAENQGLKGDYARAVQEQKEATDAVSEVQRYQAADMAENMQHGQRELAEIAAKGKESALTHDRVLQQRDQQLQDAMNAQKNMVFDPDQYVHSMNVGQKIFTAIAVGLSAMGSSRSIGGNGDNIALNMLKESIQHGVDQQKEAYRRAGVNIDMANNAYARARQAGMDDRDATAAARMASINEHKTAADVITARYEPDKIEANRKVLLANLDAEHVKAQQTFAQSSQAAAARAAADVFQTQRGVFDMGMQAQNMAWQHEDRLASQAIAQQKAAGQNRALAGWDGSTDNKEMQMAAAKLSSRERIMNRDIDDLINYRQDYGNELANREAMAKAQSTATQLQVLFKDKFQLGAMSDSDKTFLEKVAADPTKVAWTPAVVGQLKKLKQQVQADTEDEMESYGFQRDKNYKPRQIIDERPKEGGK